MASFKRHKNTRTSRSQSEEDAAMNASTELIRTVTANAGGYSTRRHTDVKVSGSQVCSSGTSKDELEKRLDCGENDLIGAGHGACVRFSLVRQWSPSSTRF